MIDFIPGTKGCSLKDNATFERVCGGAPANVAAAVSLLGGKSKMITKLGEDGFGDHIIDVLSGAGVDTSCILRTKEANTSLAFVALKPDGDREFSFYRKPGADMLFDASELKKEWFYDCGFLHFCSVNLIECPMKGAHREAIAMAKEAGAVISFDPNLRFPLWDDKEALKETVRDFLGFADIVKISDEELEFITGETKIEDALGGLFAKGVKLVMYSEGKCGVRVFTKDAQAYVPGVSVPVSDTTGAGDAVIGAFLYGLAEKEVSDVSALSAETLQALLAFANGYAAYSVMGKGAIAAYGTKEEVLAFMEEYQL